jgi:hypothetical protein
MPFLVTRSGINISDFDLIFNVMNKLVLSYDEPNSHHMLSNDSDYDRRDSLLLQN